MLTWQGAAAPRFFNSGFDNVSSCPKEPKLPGPRGVVGIHTAEVRRCPLAALLKPFPVSPLSRLSLLPCVVVTARQQIVSPKNINYALLKCVLKVIKWSFHVTG